MDISNADSAQLTPPGWTDANLATQGFDLADLEARRGSSVGLRFTTGTCLTLVIVALVLASVPMLLGLAAIAAVAGLTPRHPFDLLWNQLVRHALAADPLPPNPARRRHAFKVAAVSIRQPGV